jgi:hypothetical protein
LEFTLRIMSVAPPDRFDQRYILNPAWVSLSEAPVHVGAGNEREGRPPLSPLRLGRVPSSIAKRCNTRVTKWVGLRWSGQACAGSTCFFQTVAIRIRDVHETQCRLGSFGAAGPPKRAVGMSFGRADVT